jgi:hypothetical protein
MRQLMPHLETDLAAAATLRVSDARGGARRGG